MSNQIWFEQSAKHKKMFNVKRNKCKKKKNGREEFKELNIEAVSERWFGQKTFLWNGFLTNNKMDLIQRFFPFCACEICFG